MKTYPKNKFPHTKFSWLFDVLAALLPTPVIVRVLYRATARYYYGVQKIPHDVLEFLSYWDERNEAGELWEGIDSEQTGNDS